MRRSAVALLAFGAMIVVSAEFVVIGLMPAMTADLSLAPAQTGWLVTLFALASALLGPLLVASTTPFRPAAVLAATLMPFAATLLLIPFPSFTVTAVLRVFQGASLPLFISVASAQLALAHGTGRGIALLYIGVTVGGTLTPPFATFAAERFGWPFPMEVIGALALAIAPACLLLGSNQRTDRHTPPWRLLGRPRVRIHLILSILLFATMFTGFSYIALLLGHACLDANAVTVALLGFGALGLVGNGLAGVLARRALPATYGVALAIVAPTAWLSSSTDPSIATVGIALLVWGLAHAAGFVFCQVRVMAVAPEAPSVAASLNISAANMGIAIGSFLGGRAVEWSGLSGLGPVSFALGLLAIGVASWIARSESRRHDFEAPAA